MNSTSLGSIARRNWWLIALTAFLLAGVGVAVGLARAPTYTATVQLNVGTLDARVRAVPGYVEAAKSLASSYSRVATTERIVNPVARATRLSPAEVRNRISATPVIENPIITISAAGPSAGAARDLSRRTADALVAEVSRLDKAVGADESLLTDFRAASRRLASAELGLRALQRRRERDADSVSRSRLERQQAEVETRRLESQTVGNLYAESRARAGSAASLEPIGERSEVVSDRDSTTQKIGFAGLVAGVAVGLALAALRHAASGRRARRRASVAA